MKLWTCVLLLIALDASAATPISPRIPRDVREKLTQLLSSSKNEFEAPAPYIIDGDAAAAGAAPYLVSLSMSTLTYAHICAGVIISKEWVLTAAHCVNELDKWNNGNANGLPVYAGLHNRTDMENAQVRHIDFAYAHKEFNEEESSYDIGLLHVVPAFVFTPAVRQIALPYRDEDYTGEVSATYGWGLTDPEGEQYVSELKTTTAQVLSIDECKQELPADAPMGIWQVCAISFACYGDGGSPLVAERVGGVAELIGVTSWGYVPCAYDKRPTVYTDVAKYLDWITQVQWAYYILH